MNENIIIDQIDELADIILFEHKSTNPDIDIIHQTEKRMNELQNKLDRLLIFS